MGALVGGDAGAALGAAIGGGVGAAASFAYGNYVASKKAEFAAAEDYLDAVNKR